MARLQRANLDLADARRFPNGSGAAVRVGPLSIGRARLEPGWRWSTSIKPIVGSTWCETHHLHVLLSGRFAAQMDDGEMAEFGPGDVFELPPGHDAWVVGDEVVTLLDVLGNSSTFAQPASAERVLATLLMTDIVASTATAARMGDAGWRQALGNHNRVVRAELAQYRGREVNTTGDGFLATFASAGAAVRAAAAIRDATAALQLPVRIGVHTGEIELLPGDDVGGIAVHATARIMALAAPSEVLVSATTRALADGVGLRFERRGRHELKGIEEPMEVFALVA
jgi:class 3 adenylate cyclase